MVMRTGASGLRAPGVEANARLTGYLALVLVVLLAAETVTGLGVRGLLLPHALIGFLLIPPVVPASFVFWLVALAVHVAFHLRRAPDLASADWRDHLQGALARRSLVEASRVVGAVLAIAMLPFATPFSFTPGA